MALSSKSSRHAYSTVIAATPTALHTAAEVNDASTVTALLRRGAVDPNARLEYPNFYEGATALHVAARKGHLEAALALLEFGATPDGRPLHDCRHHPGTGRGLTAIAAATASAAATAPLLSSDSEFFDFSDSDISDDYYPNVGGGGGGGREWEGGDLTPLHLACAYGHTAVVRALLAAGGRADRLASARRVHDLYHHFGGTGAGAWTRAEIGPGVGTAPLFGGGEGERDGDEGGYTPLHVASRSGAAGAVRALVEAGASVHQRVGGECGGETPLHLASAAGREEAMAALLDAGADVDAPDECGNTPLHVARDARTLKFLLGRGHANPNLEARSPYGRGSPLGSYCTLVHRLETDEEGMANATAQVETLLRYGANVNIRAAKSYGGGHPDHDDDDSEDFRSPILSCAAKNGVPGIVSALLRAGLDPNERDRDGWAPLHDAAQGNHVDVLRVLLLAGAARDVPTTRGQWTPLHIACRYTSVDCVLELLKWGADLGPTARLAIVASEDEDVHGGCGGGGGGGSNGRRVRRRGKDGKSFLCDSRRGAAAAVSDCQESQDEEDEDGMNGYGKTPAEVIGLRHLDPAAAAATPGLAAGDGGSGPGGADPSLDEEEAGQVVVLGDDDEGARDSAVGVSERNAIRRALRREAAWRRRRSVVLIKTFAESRFPRFRRPQGGETALAVAAMPPEAVGDTAAAGTQPPIRTAGGGGGGGGGGGSSSGGSDVCKDDCGEIKRRKKDAGHASFGPLDQRLGNVTTPAAGRWGTCEMVDEDLRMLRCLLEGVVDLAAREVALFRQIVMFL